MQVLYITRNVQNGIVLFALPILLVAILPGYIDWLYNDINFNEQNPPILSLVVIQYNLLVPYAVVTDGMLKHW